MIAEVIRETKKAEEMVHQSQRKSLMVKRSLTEKRNHMVTENHLMVQKGARENLKKAPQEKVTIKHIA